MAHMQYPAMNQQSDKKIKCFIPLCPEKPSYHHQHDGKGEYSVGYIVGKVARWFATARWGDDVVMT